MSVALARKWDSASDFEIVWAKNARGVWGLTNVFANGKLYFTHDVPEANRLQQGRSPLLSPLPSLLPMLPNLVPNPQPRVQPNLLPRWQPNLQPTQPTLQLESPFLWPLFSMCNLRGLLPEKVAHRAYFSVKLNMYPNRQFLAHFVVHIPCIYVSCFASQVLCIVIGRARELSLGVCSLRGAGVRGYCCVLAITMQWGGG